MSHGSVKDIVEVNDGFPSLLLSPPLTSSLLDLGRSRRPRAFGESLGDSQGIAKSAEKQPEGLQEQHGEGRRLSFCALLADLQLVGSYRLCLVNAWAP